MFSLCLFKQFYLLFSERGFEPEIMKMVDSLSCESPLAKEFHWIGIEYSLNVNIRGERY